MNQIARSNTSNIEIIYPTYGEVTNIIGRKKMYEIRNIVRTRKMKNKI